MRRLAFIVFLSTALIGVAAPAGAIPVTVTYTADNFIEGMWYQTATSGVVSLADPKDGTWENWPTASTTAYDVTITPGETYEHVWLLENDLSFAGFLAQIDFGGSLLLSSSEWEYSTYSLSDGETITSFDESFWEWQFATELGANASRSTTWYLYNGSRPVSGIAGDAQWIWSSPRSDNPIFIKASIEIPAAPVPEPATLLLIGTGLAGLAALCRRKMKMNP